ncbi:MAG: glucan 1,4-alpha-glucosidase [Rhodospirillaceae bacterium]|nr:glucan 1,4-alpha-glucosidase [Rhodospirillaceae bacterium]
MTGTDAALPDWLFRQARIAADRLAGAVSATALLLDRRNFGQIVLPAKGSVLASPETDLDSAPDYFFHWLRDAAVVMDAVRLLAARPEGAAWRARFEDWVRFSLSLTDIDGADFLRAGDFRTRVAADFLKYVRPDAEIAALAGERVLDDVRVNADGSLDFIKWSRPQHDGAAMTALVALRFWRQAQSSSEAARAELAALIRRDLDYTLRRAGTPCFDIWEEELGHHYYTRLVQCAALSHGAAWAAARGDGKAALDYGAAAAALEDGLDEFWCEESGFYRSRLPGEGSSESKALDFATIFAVLHAGREAGRHSVADPRVGATFAKLAALFADDYALNRGAAAPFAFGRYRGDVYYSGGAYFFSSLGAAEFHYRRAACAKGDDSDADIARGDAIMAALRPFIPESGALSEQFDRTTGVQTSARNLTWSYAAFLSAIEARRFTVNT